MEDKEKLHWRVRHKRDFGGEADFLETILLDNGVKEEDIKAFLHPTKKQIKNPFLMKNMDKAVELAHKHVKNGSKIFVKVDPDADGMTSSSTLIQFLKKLNPEITVEYMLNYEKRHGLFYKDISNHTRDDIGLFIVPDASMTVQDAKMITSNFSGDILVLDHHLIESQDGDCYTNYCVAVNCTDGSYPNPTLCGAGVVQKFIEAYVQTYGLEDNIPEELTEEYLDLVSLGLVADNMDLRNLESRYYALEGMKERNCNNKFLNELVERNKDDMKYGRYITSMGWVIAPKINACVRYGKPDEQIDAFRALCGEEEEREYQPRRRSKADPLPPIEIHSLQKYMARVVDNIKSRQDTQVRKFFNEIDAKIQEEGLDRNTVIFVDGTKVLENGNVTGLIANKLASKYFRPVVLMRSKDATTYGGSMRGYQNCVIENTKEFLEKAGVTLAGHNSAAGSTFPKAELENIIAKCNEMLPPDQLTTVYQCDWEIPASQLRREYILEVAENYDVFGSTVPEPLFAITNIELNTNQIQAYGDKGNFIRITYGDTVFVKRFARHDDYERMVCTNLRETFGGATNKRVRMNVIGQCKLSEYEGKVYGEIQIVDFDSEEITEEKPVNDMWDFEMASVKTVKDEDFDW